MDHYRNPRNVGTLEDADIIGEAGSLACGDSLKLFIKLDGEKISDMGFIVTPKLDKVLQAGKRKY